MFFRAKTLIYLGLCVIKKDILNKKDFLWYKKFNLSRLGGCRPLGPKKKAGASLRRPRG